MLTRQATTALLEQLREGHRSQPAAALGEGGAVTLYAKQNNIAQLAADWVAKRGSTTWALTDFMAMFDFDDYDLAMAIDQTTPTESAESHQQANNAAVAASLINEWLNEAAREYGNSNTEYEYARLRLQQSEHKALAKQTFCSGCELVAAAFGIIAAAAFALRIMCWFASLLL